MNGVVSDDSKNRPSIDGWSQSVQYGKSIGAMGVPYLSRPVEAVESCSHWIRPGGSVSMVDITSRYSGHASLAS